ncbi:uncharacterized protein EI90DRAFT_3057580 [Cantharellus anzutake]|uniref:uncharacterized protein n=1 Tax=Cantharellus anzutake TaxID=1750568 RepID=UPI0019045F33|nr:uncharacterized protein EI90DRAFT_3057580 [Cantharellus anzutake]KAF8331331.1 hypothetical protein EI90DRAFT_3057580 [Cantharellus anzutake]
MLPAGIISARIGAMATTATDDANTFPNLLCDYRLELPCTSTLIVNLHKPIVDWKSSQTLPDYYAVKKFTACSVNTACMARAALCKLSSSIAFADATAKCPRRPRNLALKLPSNNLVPCTAIGGAFECITRTSGKPGHYPSCKVLLDNGEQN